MSSNETSEAARTESLWHTNFTRSYYRIVSEYDKYIMLTVSGHRMKAGLVAP